MSSSLLACSCPQVIRHGQVPPSGLQLDLSHFGLDDQYFREAILNVWDVTSLGVPTALVVDYNALTDLSVRALVMKMRESAQQGVCSLRSLSLDGNRTGLDSAMMLADLVEDHPGLLTSVTAYKWECSAESPQALTFMRPSDRWLSIENALVVAILVDAYVGLKRFVFTLRDCEGPLPDAFVGRRRLRGLVEFDIRGNQLEGALPPALLRIERKSLHHNRLTLPEDLRELAPLAEVDLSGIGLYGAIPAAMAHLPNLTKLNLSNNPGLSGPVPPALLLLPHLSLSGCKLCLPEEVDGLQGVASLRLARQGLVGRLPDTWTRLLALTELDVSHNQLEGPVPPALLHLPKRSFDHNHLTLPSTNLWAALGALTRIDLSNQGLCGPIPPAFTTLSRLQSFKVGGNRLTGPIPAPLLLLPSRNFGRNRLELPSDIGALLHVQSLDLNSQDLVGNIPPSWSGLTHLTRLDLSCNKLEGRLPAPLLALPHIRLHGNRLTLPDTDLDALEGLAALDLMDQGLAGELPEALGRLTSLTRLDVSGKNQLEGAIPALLLQAVDQRGLDLRVEGGNSLTLPNESLHAVASSLATLALPHANLQVGPGTVVQRLVV